jgi:hypothetical protein
LVADRQIEVNVLSVRRALARTFVGFDAGEHAWRGRAGTGATVTVDVRALADGRPYVHVSAEVLDAPLDEPLAQLLLVETGELIIGRFAHRDGRVVIEHAILAGTTMDAVEVQSSVWTVGWAAAAFGPRLRAIRDGAASPPPAPQTPASLRRDAHDHVEMTDRRVKRLLDERFGGFELDPAWGYHGAFGSARVFVDILPVLEESTAVRASSPVVSDVDLGGELALHLLDVAATTPFGAFLHIPARREVWFQHIVLGDDLDAVEFEAAIETGATMADGWDDQLATRFGGKRYADL